MSRSSGFTLAEMLVAIAIVGIAAGTAALYLKPMETSTRDGASQVEGFFKQIRFKAMATTSAYRALPGSSTQLRAETAASCASTTWISDPALTMDLPTRVSLGSTGWSLCFNSRGISSQNLTVSVQQTGRPTRSVEVLLGGTARLVP